MVPDAEDTQIAALVEAARDDSVTHQRLAGSDESPALVDVLEPGEQPHYVLCGAVVDVVDRSHDGTTDDHDRNRESPLSRSARREELSRKMPDRGFDVLTVVTDRRFVVVVPRAGDADTERVEMRYNQAEGIRLERMGQNRRLVVTGSTRRLQIGTSGSPTATCEQASAFIRTRLTDAPDSQTANREPSPESESELGSEAALSMIERLADLREQGAITETEFEEKKRELLDRV